MRLHEVGDCRRLNTGSITYISRWVMVRDMGLGLELGLGVYG